MKKSKITLEIAAEEELQTGTPRKIISYVQDGVLSVVYEPKLYPAMVPEEQQIGEISVCLDVGSANILDGLDIIETEGNHNYALNYILTSVYEAGMAKVAEFYGKKVPTPVELLGMGAKKNKNRKNN